MAYSYDGNAVLTGATSTGSSPLTAAINPSFFPSGSKLYALIYHVSIGTTFTFPTTGWDIIEAGTNYRVLSKAYAGETGVSVSWSGGLMISLGIAAFSYSGLGSLDLNERVSGSTSFSGTGMISEGVQMVVWSPDTNDDGGSPDLLTRWSTGSFAENGDSVYWQDTPLTGTTISGHTTPDAGTSSSSLTLTYGLATPGGDGWGWME